MLLAGDVGGTKTLVGLFRRNAPRPQQVALREYRTLDFDNLAALASRFLQDTGADPHAVEMTVFGVAGPVANGRARLTNVPWMVTTDAIGTAVPRGGVELINDLEALAWAVPVLHADEVAVLQEGRPDPLGNVALVAAGTGLGTALLPNVGGRFVPRASEGGHVDFAPRTADEVTLMIALTDEFGRADVEHIVSGPGIARIHRLLYPHQCESLTPFSDLDDLPAAITRAALADGCAMCTRTLECFVSAYGATAGNLALTALATAGVYLGGGIAPRILPALQWPAFIRAFRSKAPMDHLVADIPVRVILNPRAGLLGASVCAGTVAP